jgi:hypothetical protein
MRGEDERYGRGVRELGSHLLRSLSEGYWKGGLKGWLRRD